MITEGFLLLGVPQRHTPTHLDRHVSPGSSDGMKNQQRRFLSLPSTHGDGAATQWKERGRNSPGGRTRGERGGRGGGGDEDVQEVMRKNEKLRGKMTGRRGKRVLI